MLRREIEYRPTPTDTTEDTASQWRRLDVSPGEDELTVEVLGEQFVLGESYDVRTRLVDEDAGTFSEWVTHAGLVIERDGIAPEAPSQVRLTKGDCLTWEMPAEILDLRGYRIRWIPCPWEDYLTAEIVHEGSVDHAPFLLCRVPKGRGTFFVTALDWDGNESEATALIADRGPMDDQAEFSVRTRNEAALSFPGTLVGAPAAASLVASAITGAAGSQPMFGAYTEPWIPVDGAAPMIPTDPFASFFGSVWGANGPWLDRRGTSLFFGETQYQWIEYVWEFEVHCGEDGPRAVLSADIVCTSVTSGFPMPWRLMYRRKCSTAFIPVDPFEVWIPADGSQEFIPTESSRPWRPWPGRLLGVEAGVYEFRLLVPGGRERAQVTACSVTVSSEPRVRHVTGLSVPALGGTRVPPGDAWRQIIEARVTPVGTSTPTDVPVVHKSGAKGPAVRTFQSGTEATVLVDAVIRGY